MNRLLTIIVLLWVSAGLTTAFARTPEELTQIAQRMLKGEKVSHADKVAAYDTYRAMRPQRPAQPPSIMTSGGPDGYGYTFKDQLAPGGPTYGWINTIASDSVIGDMAGQDDGSVGPIGVNFPFQLYGVDFTQIYLGSNGYVTSGAFYDFSFGGFPVGGPSGIYFWADDMYMNSYSRVSIARLTSPTRFVITYDSLISYAGDFVTCQMVLNTDGSILVQYREVAGGTPTVGIQNDFGAYNLNYGITPTANTAILYKIPCANPTLSTPANGTTGVNGSSTTLTWTPGLCSVNYDVYVSTDSNSVLALSHSVRVDSGLSATSKVVSINTNRIYYWIVAGRASNGEVVASKMFHFGTSAQMTGAFTIGNIFQDYQSFTAALNDLNTYGVGAGGVTFYVRNGTYNENVVVNAIPNASASNPVTFQKLTGTVTISPPVTSGFDAGVKLNGCQYVTFDGINVTDNSNGTNYLEAGYWVTNASGSQGAQNNTIKNSTIRMRVSASSDANYPVGISQAYNNSAVPTSAAGTNSNNSYLNLEISKSHIGVYLLSYSNFPDQAIEIGSDVMGVSNSNRFIIGSASNDTIGGYGNGYGIFATNLGTLNVHDVDITNVLTSGLSGSAIGIYLIRPFGTTNIYNNRIYTLTAVGTGSTFNPVYGVWSDNGNTTPAPVRLYNNMIYGLVSAAANAIQTASYNTLGIYAINNITIDNNSILLNQLSGPNLLASSADIELTSGGADTILNNVITNYTATQSNNTFHVGIYDNGATSLRSNFNCFYIPNATNGKVGFIGGSYYPTLANWKLAQTNIDSISQSGNPLFISSTSPYNLHITLGQPSSLVEGKASPLAFVTTDIDGEARSVGAPDIGADEGAFLGTSVALVKPVGGENYFIGAVDSVRWLSHGISSVDIKINRTYPSGSWTTIASSVSSSDNGTNTYQWTVTGPVTTTARIAVISHTNSTYADTCFANFNVIQPTIALTRPNGGEVLYIGQTDSVTWTTNLTGNVNIKYTSNFPTGPWTTLFSNMAASLGKLTFPVPNAPSTTIRFAVVSTYIASMTDTSNAPLTIRARAMTLSNPNGGEIAYIGIPDTIRWANFGTYPKTIGISYAGAVPESVTVFTNTLPANTTSYIWNPSGRTSTHARIYLADSTTVVGWSANDFTVALPALQLTRPNGGETFYRGENDTIRWIATNLSGTVRVELNRTFPSSTWETLDSTSLATQNYWAWNGIAGSTSNTARIWVKSNFLAFAIDTSDANFSIVQRNLILTRPNGGETFRVGTPDTIRFTGNFITNGVRVELNRTFPSSTWELLVDSANAATGFWAWNSVTAPVTANARIRITARGLTPVYNDTSNLNFAIQPQPVLYQSRSTINFAGTAPGATDSLLLVIKNQSNIAFHYLTLTGATGKFSKRVVDTDSLTNANDSLQIWIRFSPDSARIFSDTLRMTFESPYNSITIPISGVGAGCYATLSSYSATFATTIEPTRSDSISVKLHVQGTIPLQNAHWIIIPPSLPYTVTPVTMPSVNPGDSATAWIHFLPTAPGTFTGQVGLVSTAVNEDTLRVNVTGNSAYVTPAAPGALTITKSGSDIVLNWSRVDTTISGVPVTVVGYNIYISTNGLQPYSLLGTNTGANTTSYTHTAAITTSPFHGYYKVTAYFGSSSSDRIRRVRVGMSEAEVNRILSNP